ncbi:hypothetical protein R1sor_015036 [Riccia sorocarpa]|uniref:Uncharacterized protein n=1 Tax=Riccia sorocarpa TaxID=122646 RepID=A0ABD3HB36_9MARC
MDRADRLLKRTAVKKEPLEETDSENWTTIARDVIGGVDARTPTKSPKMMKRKGKSGKPKANEEEKHDPTPEDPKDSPAKPSGSGKPAPPYGDLPTKFEKFCSQFGSQRSEGIPDMFNDPESVQKIQFATSLLADVYSLQAVNTYKYNSQYSQPVDLRIIFSNRT